MPCFKLSLLPEAAINLILSAACVDTLLTGMACSLFKSEGITALGACWAEGSHTASTDAALY